MGGLSWRIVAVTFLSPNGSSMLTFLSPSGSSIYASFVSGSPPGYICDAPLTGHHPGGLVPKCNLLFNYFFLKKIACHKHNSEGAHLFVPLHARFEDLTENEKGKLLSEHDNLLQKLKGIRCLLREAQMQHHQKFHKVWGQLMKTGYQNSRFAHQVERFACLYCSQVTDFGLYSPNKYYRPSEDYMPHEFDVLGL